MAVASVTAPSPTHLVLIPSYNTGPRLIATVRAARAEWAPAWVVLDGSNDGSLEALQAAFRDDQAFRVLSLPANRGKGAAILHGLRAAGAEGFTHVLTMDADGQHPAHLIRTFMEASQATPEALILGVPVFDQDAPAARVRGRRVSNWWANLETLWQGIGDSLFGFRVYPIADLLAVMAARRSMRGFDFEPEAAVRLCWRGLELVNLPAPVRYFGPAEGGVSHFRYGRDNVLLTLMHTRLVLESLLRLPLLPGRRRARGRQRRPG
jgi:glycosyltransferase involved in cell wall biosynthesis